MRRNRYTTAALSLVAFLAMTVAAPQAGAAPARRGPPPAPTDLAISGHGSSATLSWRQPPGSTARSFRVYEASAVTARNTTTFVQLTNLGFARSRSFTVTALDERGRESAHSVPISRTLGISGVPPQCYPTGLAHLSATEVTGSAVTLDWENLGDAGIVTVLGGPGGPVSTHLSSVRIGGLSPATAYTFSVQRRNHCPMPDMPAVPVTVLTAPGAPGRPDPPVEPAVVARTDATVTVSWQPPAGGTRVSRYVVYDGGRPVATTGATSATVRGLYHAAGYEFTVAALDARGNESAGVGVAGRTATCQSRPPRPVAVTARALSASSVRLDWVQEAAAVSYTVYDNDAVVGTSVGTAAVISGLPSASTHHLRVVASLVAGCGATRASAAARVTTPAGPPARPIRPEQLRVASADPLTGTVGLRWTQPVGDDPAIAYRLYRGAEVVATGTGTDLAVRLPMATTQVLTVAAVNADGLESAQSAPLTVQVPYLPPP